MLEQLRSILGLTGVNSPAQDTLLNMYLSNAQQEFLMMTNLSEIPEKAGNIIVLMAAIQYNKQGSQGAATENHGGGVSISWEKDYPPNILRAIATYKVIKW